MGEISLDEPCPMFSTRGESGMTKLWGGRFQKSAETVINAHWFDGVFYIPNCDKITPGMLMAAVRTNVPSVFVSGGPMEAGTSATGKQLSLTRN